MLPDPRNFYNILTGAWKRQEDAQLTKNVTKAPAVTTVLNNALEVIFNEMRYINLRFTYFTFTYNRHTAKLSSKQHCLQAGAHGTR